MQPESAADTNAADKKSARIKSPDLPAPSARTLYSLSANFDFRIQESLPDWRESRNFRKARQGAAILSRHYFGITRTALRSMWNVMP
jgi:hypothetical protein